MIQEIERQEQKLGIVSGELAGMGKNSSILISDINQV